MIYDFNNRLKWEDGFISEYCYKPSRTELTGKSPSQILYNTHNYLFPMEREVDITAINWLLTNLHCVDKKVLIKDELKYFQMLFVDYLLRDYQKELFGVVSPSQKLLKYVSECNRDIYEKLFKNSHLPLYNRLELGLPVTPWEYMEVEDIYFKIKIGKLPVETDVKSLIIKRK